MTTPSASRAAHVHTIHDYWLLCQRVLLVRRDGTVCERRCASCVAISQVRNRIIERHPADVVIAVSHAVARQHEGIPWLRDRTRVIYNPIDPFPSSATSRGVLTFGYIGQLIGVKGVVTLLDAFRRARLTDARLLVAGDGPLRSDLEAMAPESVEFLGWIDAARKAAFFAEIDCLVVPSEWKDPAPLVVNEARAAGVPVIGARAGGIPELVAPASVGLLFPSGDVRELAQRMQDVATGRDRYCDPTRGVAMDWDRHLDLVEGAYADARRNAHKRAGRRSTR